MVEISVEPTSDSSSSIYLLLDPQQHLTEDLSWQHPARAFIAPITESSHARNASQCLTKSNACNSAGRQSARCVRSEWVCASFSTFEWHKYMKYSTFLFDPRLRRHGQVSGELILCPNNSCHSDPANQYCVKTWTQIYQFCDFSK